MHSARAAQQKNTIYMSENYRIYLDVCCLNRPFDNQSQPRITQAILSIVSQCESGQWKLMTSTAIDAELNQTTNLERLHNVKTILKIAKIRVISSQSLDSRSRELQRLGFTGYDAAHIASAERGRADVFLSTDDRLIKRAKRNTQLIRVPVDNPAPWLIQTTQTEDNDRD